MNRTLSAARILTLLIASAFLPILTCEAQDSDKRAERYKAALEKYVDVIIEKYDDNEDGALQAEELKKMRREPKDADLDGDGSLTKDELLEKYSQSMVKRDEAAAQQGRNSRDRSRSRSRSRKSPSQSARPRKERPEVMSVGGLAAVQPIAKKDSDAKEEEQAAVSDDPVSVSVFMFRGKDSEKIRKLGKLLRGESQNVVESLLREYAKTLDSNFDLDTLDFSAAWDQQLKLSVASIVPVIKSVSRGRNTTQSSVSNYDVGARLEVTLRKKDDQPFMVVEMSKANVFESNTVLFKTEAGKETLASQISTVELEQAFPFEMNKASVVSMSDSDSSWLLIFVVH